MAEKSFFEMTMDAPWPFGFVLGIVGFVGCNWVLPAILLSLDNPYLKPIGEQWQRNGAFYVGYAILFVFWIGALASFIRQRVHARRKAKFKQGDAGFSALASDAQPTCPKCGEAMVMRTARASGDRFWGCSAFPKCRGTLAVGKS